MTGSMVTKAAGISRNALINYEAHGAVSPARDENGYRSYSRGDLLDVMCCTMLTSMGYSVAEAAEMLRGDELMGVGHIDGYIERLTRQRDAIQAKIENLAELRRATLEARPAGEATFEAVECPEWLFFFDEHESVDIRDVKSDNQTALLRSVPLSCRGFTLEGFFDEGACVGFTGRAPCAGRTSASSTWTRCGTSPLSPWKSRAVGGRPCCGRRPPHRFLTRAFWSCWLPSRAFRRCKARFGSRTARRRSLSPSV